jgi:imidazole glycerol-phosphate synthase subunit HisH
MIVIIDYQMGNLGSILNMLKKIGTDAVISSKVCDIDRAEKLILPGVGAFDNGMKNLKEAGLLGILNEKVIVQKAPILGVCLGMQLLTKRSEEGILPGLGWLDAETVRFRFPSGIIGMRVPHMGWNTIQTERSSPLVSDLDQESRFYFVHSYHLICNQKEDSLALTPYGYDFTSIVQRENVYGTQFHPEKSHRYGMKVLCNFAKRV